MIEDFLIDLENIQLEDMEIDFNMEIDIDLNIDFEIDVDLDGLDLTLPQRLMCIGCPRLHIRLPISLGFVPDD
ncbi:TPA: hypothetical protein ACPXTC_000516 [Streptococcus pneumoniae]